MRLFLFSLLISGAFATKYNVFDYLDTSDVVPVSDCPPLYYGKNCNVPYCYPESGLLKQRTRSKDIFFCDCVDSYSQSGEHCEQVDCHYGILSNSTLQCECPDNVWGAYCESTTLQLLSILGFLICCCMVVFLIPANKHATTATNNRTSTAPAPEIRIVERVVIQERSDAPPTYYDSAIDPANPPKYTV
uniref:EGF-like domain-containing protein n=1 Tax=Panagrellus redivivus TaxID=6233 RepID=A0A7E4ZUT5_PANRE